MSRSLVGLNNDSSEFYTDDSDFNFILQGEEKFTIRPDSLSVNDMYSREVGYLTVDSNGDIKPDTLITGDIEKLKEDVEQLQEDVTEIQKDIVDLQVDLEVISNNIEFNEYGDLLSKSSTQSIGVGDRRWNSINCNVLDSYECLHQLVETDRIEVKEDLKSKNITSTTINATTINNEQMNYSFEYKLTDTVDNTPTSLLTLEKDYNYSDPALNNKTGPLIAFNGRYSSNKQNKLFPFVYISGIKDSLTETADGAFSISTVRDNNRSSTGYTRSPFIREVVRINNQGHILPYNDLENSATRTQTIGSLTRPWYDMYSMRAFFNNIYAISSTGSSIGGAPSPFIDGYITNLYSTEIKTTNITATNIKEVDTINAKIGTFTGSLDTQLLNTNLMRYLYEFVAIDNNVSTVNSKFVLYKDSSFAFNAGAGTGPSLLYRGRYAADLLGSMVDFAMVSGLKESAANYTDGYVSFSVNRDLDRINGSKPFLREVLRLTSGGNLSPRLSTETVQTQTLGSTTFPWLGLYALDSYTNNIKKLSTTKTSTIGSSTDAYDTGYFGMVQCSQLNKPTSGLGYIGSVSTPMDASYITAMQAAQLRNLSPYNNVEIVNPDLSGNVNFDPSASITGVIPYYNSYDMNSLSTTDSLVIKTYSRKFVTGAYPTSTGANSTAIDSAVFAMGNGRILSINGVYSWSTSNSNDTFRYWRIIPPYTTYNTSNSSGQPFGVFLDYYDSLGGTVRVRIYNGYGSTLYFQYRLIMQVYINADVTE